MIKITSKYLEQLRRLHGDKLCQQPRRSLFLDGYLDEESFRLTTPADAFSFSPTAPASLPRQVLTKDSVVLYNAFIPPTRLQGLYREKLFTATGFVVLLHRQPFLFYFFSFPSLVSNLTTTFFLTAISKQLDRFFSLNRFTSHSQRI